MKSRTLFALAGALFVFSATQTQAQESSPDSLVRPRVVAQQTLNPKLPSPSKESEKLGAPPATVAPGTTAPAEATQSTTATPTKSPIITAPVTTAPLTYLTPSLIQSRIGEARRLLKTRPMTTALAVPSIDLVTIAALERETSRTHLIT